VTGNAVSLTIIPATKTWQKLILRSALMDLDSHKPTMGIPHPDDPYRNGTKTLCFLGTPEAAQELARRINGDRGDWELEGKPR